MLATQAVEKLTNDNADIQAGINIIRRALESPLRQIAENAGVEGSIVVGKVLDGKGKIGFDAQNETYCDLIAAGIVDPAKVVTTALARCCFGCRSSDYHRSHGCRKTGTGRAAPAMPRYGRHGRYGRLEKMMM